MADTTWDEWRAAANEYAERCYADWMSESIFRGYLDDEEEEFDDEEDC